MLWVYVLLTTVGLVALVPTVLRALDDMPADVVTGVAGFFGTFAGLTGLFCRQVGVSGWITLAAAGALGLGAATLHPELLSLLQGNGLSGERGLSDDRGLSGEPTSVTPYDES